MAEHDRVQRVPPTDAMSWHSLGLTLGADERIVVNNIERSNRDCFVEALKLNPNEDTYWHNIGMTLAFDERVVVKNIVRTKRDCYLEALKLNPTNAGTWNSLGLTLGADESLVIDGALYSTRSCFAKALSVDPTKSGRDAAAAWTNLASCLPLNESVLINDAPHDASLCYAKSVQARSVAVGNTNPFPSAPKLSTLIPCAERFVSSALPSCAFCHVWSRAAFLATADPFFHGGASHISVEALTAAMDECVSSTYYDKCAAAGITEASFEAILEQLEMCELRGRCTPLADPCDGDTLESALKGVLSPMSERLVDLYAEPLAPLDVRIDLQWHRFTAAVEHIAEGYKWMQWLREPSNLATAQATIAALTKAQEMLPLFAEACKSVLEADFEAQILTGKRDVISNEIRLRRTRQHSTEKAEQEREQLTERISDLRKHIESNRYDLLWYWREHHSTPFGPIDGVKEEDRATLQQLLEGLPSKSVESVVTFVDDLSNSISWTVDSKVRRAHLVAIPDVTAIVKTLSLSSNAVRARVERDAKALRRLSEEQHPNIVALLDAFIDGTCAHLILEHHPTNLFNYAKEYFGDADKVRKAVCEVLRGLDRLHSRGIVHFDINPENIFISAKGEAVLGNFDSRRNATAYMAPELVDSAQRVDLLEKITTKVDMYSLGYMLLSMLKLKPFYAAWDSLIRQLLNMDPTNRPSADELLARHPLFVDVRRSKANAARLLLVPLCWNSPCGTHVINAQNNPMCFDALQGLLMGTGLVRTLGTDRDQALPVTFKLVKALRFESKRRWATYAQKRLAVVRSCRRRETAKIEMPLLHVLSASRFLRDAELDPTCNETYLWHGTNSKVAGSIAVFGLDERLCVSHGLGRGLHFADKSSKSDQYCTPNEEGLYPMFLCRVVLGSPFQTEVRLSNHRRPPIDPNGDLHDSVIGPTGPTNYTEYAVYDRAQTYPEYLLWYKREQTESDSTFNSEPCELTSLLSREVQQRDVVTPAFSFHSSFSAPTFKYGRQRNKATAYFLGVELLEQVLGITADSTPCFFECAHDRYHSLPWITQIVLANCLEEDPCRRWSTSQILDWLPIIPRSHGTTGDRGSSRVGSGPPPSKAHGDAKQTPLPAASSTRQDSASATATATEGENISALLQSPELPRLVLLHGPPGCGKTYTCEELRKSKRDSHRIHYCNMLSFLQVLSLCTAAPLQTVFDRIVDATGEDNYPQILILDGVCLLEDWMAQGASPLVGQIFTFFTIMIRDFCRSHKNSVILARRAKDSSSWIPFPIAGEVTIYSIGEPFAPDASNDPFALSKVWAHSDPAVRRVFAFQRVFNSLPSADRNKNALDVFREHIVEDLIAKESAFVISCCDCVFQQEEWETFYARPDKNIVTHILNSMAPRDVQEYVASDAVTRFIARRVFSHFGQKTENPIYTAALMLSRKERTISSCALEQWLQRPFSYRPPRPSDAPSKPMIASDPSRFRIQKPTSRTTQDSRDIYVRLMNLAKTNREAMQNIVEIFEVLEIEVLAENTNVREIEMERVQPLDRMNREENICTRLRYALDIARGLQTLHQHGIHHLDVKPGNVGLACREDGSKVAKLFDFDAAQWLNEDLEWADCDWHTPELMTPEQRKHIVTTATDTGQLCACLIHLLAGEMPKFDSEEEPNTFKLKVHRAIGVQKYAIHTFFELLWRNWNCEPSTGSYFSPATIDAANLGHATNDAVNPRQTTKCAANEGALLGETDGACTFREALSIEKAHFGEMFRSGDDVKQH